MKEKIETLNQQLVSLATQFTAKKDDHRWYLHGVYAEPNKTGGATIIATNGHRIVIYFDADGYLEEPVLVRPDATFIREGKKPNDLNRCLVIREEKDIFLKMSNGYTSDSDINNLKGAYPDVANSGLFDTFLIWTDKGQLEDPTGAFAVDSLYLKDLEAMVPKTTVHGKASKPGRALFEVISGAPEQAITFYNRAHEILILIMPVKDAGAIDRPDWLSSFLGMDDELPELVECAPEELEETGGIIRSV